jgi:AcrR family transcriptional regulator
MTNDIRARSAKPLTSRRERKKLQTRQAILEAAMSLMIEHGYQGVKIEDITKRADVANATFFLHFPTKASLITAFNKQIFIKVADRIKDKKLCAVEKLELLHTIVSDEWEPYEALLQRLMTDMVLQEGDEVIGSISGLSKIVADIVAEGQKKGQLSLEVDPALVAMSLIGAWRAVTIESVRAGAASGARHKNGAVLDLLLKGALPR